LFILNARSRSTSRECAGMMIPSIGFTFSGSLPLRPCNRRMAFMPSSKVTRAVAPNTPSRRISLSCPPSVARRLALKPSQRSARFATVCTSVLPGPSASTMLLLRMALRASKSGDGTSTL